MKISSHDLFVVGVPLIGAIALYMLASKKGGHSSVVNNYPSMGGGYSGIQSYPTTSQAAPASINVGGTPTYLNYNFGGSHDLAKIRPLKMSQPSNQSKCNGCNDPCKTAS